MREIRNLERFSARLPARARLPAHHCAPFPAARYAEIGVSLDNIYEGDYSFASCLAMLAVAGFVAQELVNNVSILDNLDDLF